MIKEAIILAGGLGTRLRSTIPDLPKCMAPVAGKPFISYLVRYFQKQGIERFIFSVGYKHEIIEQFLQNEFRHLNYQSSVESEPLGTGGAILKACTLVSSENVLVLNGDTFFEINIEQLSKFHEAKKSDCTLSLKEMINTSRYGVVETDAGGRIVAFREKRFYEKALINGGVYALNVSSFIKENLPEKFSFENDYFEKLFEHQKMYGIKQDGYFIDIGIPEDYLKAQTDFTSGILTEKNN